MKLLKDKFMHYWTDHKVEAAIVVGIIIICLVNM